MSIKFQAAATIETISTRADKTIKVVVGTQELTPEQASLLMFHNQKLGWFLFSENEFTEEDIPTEQAPEFKQDKSPSQRLRNVLYVYWKENTKQTKTFNVFYNEWYEKKIEEVKKYLPDQ